MPSQSILSKHAFDIKLARYLMSPFDPTMTGRPLTIDAVIDTSQPFVLIEKSGRVSCHQGEYYLLDRLEDIHDLSKKTKRDVAFALPYRVIRERGFAAKGDEPIVALAIETTIILSAECLVQRLPESAVELEGEIEASVSDEEYSAMVARFQENEIEGGNASQTILSRRFTGRLKAMNVGTILSIYRKLLETAGQYMTVLFAGGSLSERPGIRQFLIGATPERHLEVSGNETIMIPIAGTMRRGDQETFSARLHDFMSDSKEINELFQVMDEEMKLMSVICPEGGMIRGPLLREIGAVIHTEYELVGRRGNNTIDALRHTLHAPTVTGSPMESAARIISKYEADSRRYYGGEVGVYKQPRTSSQNGDLDTAILIRCAEITGDGQFCVQAGAGLVRDSDPVNEANETRAKAMGLLGVLAGGGHPSERYLTDSLLADVQPVLNARNAHLSQFWMTKQNPLHAGHVFPGRRVTIINNEDDFAFMLGHMLRAMGAEVKVVDTFQHKSDDPTSDLVIIGPGPGDPCDMSHPRMARLQTIIGELKEAATPILGVCLGHQVLAVHEGIDVRRQERSSQGMQLEVRVFGEMRRLGFYNSFSPVMSERAHRRSDIRMEVDNNDRIITMQGDKFIGFQFHPESVMSEMGYFCLYSALKRLLPDK